MKMIHQNQHKIAAGWARSKRKAFYVELYNDKWYVAGLFSSIPQGATFYVYFPDGSYLKGIKK